MMAKKTVEWLINSNKTLDKIQYLFIVVFAFTIGYCIFIIEFLLPINFDTKIEIVLKIILIVIVPWFCLFFVIIVPFRLHKINAPLRIGISSDKIFIEYNSITKELLRDQIKDIRTTSNHDYSGLLIVELLSEKIIIDNIDRDIKERLINITKVRLFRNPLS